MFEDPILFFLVIAALLIDIVGAIYMLQLARRSPKWLEGLIDEWRGGTLLDNLIQKDEEGEIMMDERLVSFIDALGSRLFQSGKMSMLQGLSVNSKLEKGLKGAFAKDIVDNKMPLLSLVGDFLGYNVKEYIGKNPDALMQLISMPQVQGLLGQVMGNNGGQRAQSSSVPSM